MIRDSYGQPIHPDIRLERTDGETTLWIDDRQAMQAWERDLMVACANILVQHGTDFLEVGLGLALSTTAISAAPTTRRHVVVEKYREVIDLYTAEHPIPAPMEIVHADIFDWVRSAEGRQFDGIMFDPSLPVETWEDADLWRETVPHLRRLLRPGGVFIPFFNTSPTLREQYVDHFDVAMMLRTPYAAYPGTHYKHTPTELSGFAFLQYFYATTSDVPIRLRLSPIDGAEPQNGDLESRP